MTGKKYTKIYFRVFPTTKTNWNYLKILNDQKTIYIRCLQELSKSKENVVPTFWTFCTDHVFFSHTQQQIYENIGPEVLENVMQGNDAIIMAYGQTGCGKSLTINGAYSSYENRGILPRLSLDLFEIVKRKNNLKHYVDVSYVEFFGTTVNDLLQPYPNQINNLKEVTKTRVKTLNEVLKVIFRGEGRKVLSENSHYASHSCTSIFTFHINVKDTELQDNAIRKSKLHVIDLAGVDTVGNFTCLFKNAQEIGAANLAKTQLEQFFLVLCSAIPERIKVKQRLNPMIYYLSDSLNGSTILRFIGHIRASQENLLITLSLLRFGELVGGLKSTKYQVNITQEVNRDRVDNLQKELTQLHESKSNRISMQQDLIKSLNSERLAHIERTVNEYLENKITQKTLLNVCDLGIVLEVLKMICQKFDKEKIKESLSTKMKRVSSSSSHLKGQRTSRSSIKSSSEKLKKISDDKHVSERIRASSAIDASSIKDQMSMKQDTTKQKRTSSSSLLRRSSTSRRNSTSSTSVRKRSKSKESNFVPDILPEYSEAWNSYLQERHEEYKTLTDLYLQNQAAAKEVYRTCAQELEKLREITSRVEKINSDVLMGKLTREFLYAKRYEGGTLQFSTYEKCCKRQLEETKQEELEKQEFLLKCQAELKACIKACKQNKEVLKEKFNLYCQEKYQMPVLQLEPHEEDEKDIVQTLLEQEEEICNNSIPIKEEAKVYNSFKNLIEIEKRNKKLYEMTHRKWVTY